jgi:hypothetical protein
MRTAPEVFPSRLEAERTLCRLSEDGRADCDYDRRYRAMVLLATLRVCAGVKSLRRRDVTLTWQLRWFGCGPLTPTGVRPAARSRLDR